MRGPRPASLHAAARCRARPAPSLRTLAAMRFGFRPSFLTIGVVYVLLAASILVRGVDASMSPFGVPADVVRAPHYVDAITWVYVHQMVIGVVIATLGLVVHDARAQVVLARVLAAAHVVYVFLDVRSSELATALYRGPASVVPAVIGVVASIVLARLAVQSPRAEA